MIRMRESITSKTYDLWSLFYDYTFGMLVRGRQVRAIAQLQFQPGDKVLDLGVGTGLLLQNYPRHVTVVGIDLSAGMLAKADEKRRELRLNHCHLVQGDAMLPPFAPASFDHIVITHVVSVVSDPGKLMDWALRLLKPGGRIVMLNHFRSDHAWVAWGEKFFNPIFVKIGWRSDLALEHVLEGVDAHVEYCFKMGMIDLWRIVVLRHRQPGESPVKVKAIRPKPPNWWQRRLVMQAR